MARETCDGCGKSVSIGGAFANLWDLRHKGTDGMTLELADGTEHFLCQACIDRLPSDREVTAEDVHALAEASSGDDQTTDE